MKKILIYVLLLLCSFVQAKDCKPKQAERWGVEKANKWYAQQIWPVGMNYVVSNAVNQFEMWQPESFDPVTIDKELKMAEELGFNTVRVFLHDMLWEADPTGLKKRIDKFMDIADQHGMKLIITFFTNGGKYENPKLGKQPDPIQGVHGGGRWVQAPGTAKVNNPETWGVLKKYVQDILTTFKNDDRVLMWCLYNEPENFNQGAQTLPLLRQVFKWAREVNPSQPLSAPIWIRPGYKGSTSAMDIISFLGENCDIMTFHCYYGPEEMETFIKMLKRFNRPMICTEYMGRPRSTFEEILPILKREKIGAINWGLVNGKMNFHLPWANMTNSDPKIWFHDIFHTDGTPYSEQEVDFIREMTKDKSLSGQKGNNSTAIQ